MSTGQVGRSRDLDRLLTFVDAVVAIAITAQIGGFLLTFAVIANAWSTQHQVYRSVVAADRLLTRLLLL